MTSKVTYGTSNILQVLFIIYQDSKTDFRTLKLHFKLASSSLFLTKVSFLLCEETFDLFNSLASVLSVFACVLNQPLPTKEISE